MRNLWYAAAYLLSAMMMYWTSTDFEGTEYSGGRISGPLLELLAAGGLLFVVASALCGFRPKAAATVSLVASALSLPLYLFNTLPVSFLARILPFPSSVPDASGRFRFDRWQVACMLVLLVVIYASCQTRTASARIPAPEVTGNDTDPIARNLPRRVSSGNQWAASHWRDQPNVR